MVMPNNSYEYSIGISIHVNLNIFANSFAVLGEDLNTNAHRQPWKNKRFRGLDDLLHLFPDKTNTALRIMAM